jgi:type II secretory pathway pseudopilin PulG
MKRQAAGAGRSRRPRAGGAAGETLIELLLAIAILSIAVVVIVGAMATAISSSNQHRRQATAATYLTTAAENVKSADYSPCPGASYSSGMSVSGWTITADDVMAINSDGTFGACASSDTGLQRVTITVHAPGGFSASTQIVKRDPS